MKHSALAGRMGDGVPLKRSRGRPRIHSPGANGPSSKKRRLSEMEQHRIGQKSPGTAYVSGCLALVVGCEDVRGFPGAW